VNKKQRITLLTTELKSVADAFGIILEKKVTVRWDEDCKEVYFGIIELPSENKTVNAMNAQTILPMFMILDNDRQIVFEIDCAIVLECAIDKFNKAALKRVERYITQNYKYQDLQP
jgi:hypothetical protein